MSSSPLGLNWRLGLIAVALVSSAFFSQLQVMGWSDSQLHDLFTRWLPPRSAPAQVVMVDIDERSLAEIGPWPWPRPVIAQLMQSLRDRGVRLQVWDLFLAEPAFGDAQIEQILANAKSDILLSQVLVVDPAVQDPPHAGRLLASPDAPDLCASHPPIIGQFGVASTLQPRFVGHISATPDMDGRLRKLPAVLCQAGQRYPQLSIAAAMALEPDAPWTLRPGNFPLGPDRWLERGKLQFALDKKGYMPIPYHRPHMAWPAISASRLLDPDASLLPLQNQIVVIGATALGLGDTINTPHHAHAPGASVHAELIGAAIDHDWIVSPRSPALISALMAAGLALVLLPLLQLQRRPAWSALALAGALAAPLLIAVFGRFADMMLPMTAPCVALMCFSLGLFMAQADTERRQVLRLAAHLESFLPRGLAHEIAQQNPSGESLGKPCEGVLVALRIVGLERWIGAVDSLQALALVHAVSTLADRRATQHGGALEHVQGETFLLAWPHSDKSGVNAAIDVSRKLIHELEPMLQHNESEYSPLGARVAVEAGSFLVGVVGSRASRRPLLLGPVADTVLAMLPLCDELAAPLLVGPHAAGIYPHETLHSLGQFLLPDQMHPKPLYRSEV